MFTGCLTPGCVDIDGGAIELSWQFRSKDGDVFTCEELLIRKVRLVARPSDGRVGASADYLFDCQRDVGTTSFDVPEGEYAITIEPLCGDTATSMAASGTVVPPPIVREVRRGELTQLNALLVIAEAQPACPAPT